MSFCICWLDIHGLRSCKTIPSFDIDILGDSVLVLTLVRFDSEGSSFCFSSMSEISIGLIINALRKTDLGNMDDMGSSIRSWSGLRLSRSSAMSFVPGLYVRSMLNSDNSVCH